MYQTTEYSSYDLIHNIDNSWTLKTYEKALFHGDLKIMVAFMVVKLHFEFSQIEIAIEELDKKDHNVANFGVYKNFNFTKDRRTLVGVA